MIDNDSTNQSSLMRIIRQQAKSDVPEDDLEDVYDDVKEAKPFGGQLYKIRQKLEGGERKTSATQDLQDFPCRPGNVASLRAQLSPKLMRSTSNFSNASDVSVNSVLSKFNSPRSSDNFETPKPTKRPSKLNKYENCGVRRGSKPAIPPKPTNLYPAIRVVNCDRSYENVKCDENDSVLSENSAEYESISDESRMCESMRDLNTYENVDDGVVNLPYIEPVGESSDGFYEDIDLPNNNDVVGEGKCLETSFDQVGDDDDDFGFEKYEEEPQLKVNEIFNGSVQSLPESKRNKHKRKLKERIDELIQSEVNYIERLKHVVNDYMPEMDSDDKIKNSNVTPDFTKENIFFNIKDILNFHEQTILPNLKRHKRNLRHLTEIFVKKDQLSSLYIDYASNYKKASKIVYNNIDFFKEKQRELNKRLNLAGYLLEPIQRLPRYALFLDELLKSYKLYAEGKKEDSAYYSARNSPTGNKIDEDNYEKKLEDDDKIIKAFQDASSTIKQILNRIDDNLTISYIKNSMVSLRDQGDLLMHDEFKVNQSGRKNHMRCFLFEKIVIFTIIDKSQPKEEYYMYHDSIPVTHLGITPPEHEEYEKFEIYYLKRDVKTFYLESSVKVCQCWVKKISSLLWQEALDKKKMLLNRDGERWTNSLKPISRDDRESGNNEPSSENLAGSSTSRTLPPEKCTSTNSRKRRKRKKEVKTNTLVNEALKFVDSSLRGVRGEMKQRRLADRKRTTWYVDEGS